jgi:hypothetical protein
VANKTPTILDRLAALEEQVTELSQKSQTTIQEFAQAVAQELQSVKGAASNIVEVVNAIIALNSDSSFEQKVQAHIESERKKRNEEASARAKALLESLVQAGALTPVNVIAENSVVVGREFNKEGVLTGTGRAQVRYNQFVPEAQKQLLGQGPGFVVHVDNGSFEVTEIYDPSEPKAVEAKADRGESYADGESAATPVAAAAEPAEATAELK